MLLSTMWSSTSILSALEVVWLPLMPGSSLQCAWAGLTTWQDQCQSSAPHLEQGGRSTRMAAASNATGYTVLGNGMHSLQPMTSYAPDEFLPAAGVEPVHALLLLGRQLGHGQEQRALLLAGRLIGELLVLLEEVEDEDRLHPDARQHALPHSAPGWLALGLQNTEGSSLSE